MKRHEVKRKVSINYGRKTVEEDKLKRCPVCGSTTTEEKA